MGTAATFLGTVATLLGNHVWAHCHGNRGHSFGNKRHTLLGAAATFLGTATTVPMPYDVISACFPHPSPAQIVLRCRPIGVDLFASHCFFVIAVFFLCSRFRTDPTYPQPPPPAAPLREMASQIPEGPSQLQEMRPQFWEATSQRRRLAAFFHQVANP